MAEIATYQCDNYRCRFTVRVCKDFPIWRIDAPIQVRSIAPAQEHLRFVERYRSERYCHHCRIVIVDANDLDCPRCGANDLADDQTGRPCAQCTSGTFMMANLSVR